MNVPRKSNKRKEKRHHLCLAHFFQMCFLSLGCFRSDNTGRQQLYMFCNKHTFDMAFQGNWITKKIFIKLNLSSVYIKDNVITMNYIE